MQNTPLASRGREHRALASAQKRAPSLKTERFETAQLTLEHSTPSTAAFCSAILHICSMFPWQVRADSTQQVVAHRLGLLSS